MAGNCEDPFFLTPLDNLPTDGYVHKVFFFRSNADQASVVQTLRSALGQTMRVLPLLAGLVEPITRAHQLSRLAVTKAWRTADEMLTAKDLTEADFPDYETLRSMHFPMVHVDYPVLLSLPKQGAPRPVFMAQANFIKGGLVLGTAIDHAFTDGAGSVSVMRVWAAYCRGDDGVRTVAADILDRTRLMEGTRAATLDEFPGYTYVGKSNESAKVSPHHHGLTWVFRSLKVWMACLIRFPINLGRGIIKRWSYFLQAERQTIDETKDANPLAQEVFFFPRANLNELKMLAAKRETGPNSESAEWISTNDALASLLWFSIVSAVKKRVRSSSTPIANQATTAELKKWSERVPMISKPSPSEPVSTLGFVLNGRRLMEPPITPDYIGNVVLWAGIAAPLSSVNSTIESVGEAARFLRRGINLYDGGNFMRLIGAISALRDITKVALSPGPLPDTTVAVNSWADQGFYDLDWGNVVGGKCERIRVPPTPVPNFCLVFPRLDPERGYAGGAGLEVEICIKHEDMKLLKEDELFNRFAVWRCH